MDTKSSSLSTLGTLDWVGRIKWGPNEDTATKRSEGKLEAWGSGTLPITEEEEGASPTGLLSTESLSGMNVPLYKVLVCSKVGCGVEGPWKSLPPRCGIIEAQSQCQVGFRELQSLRVLASEGVRSPAL